MNDGRLLWMRYEHHGIQDYFPLMVSRPDGTFVEEMFGFKNSGYNLSNNKDNVRVYFEFTQLPEPDSRIISTAMWHFYTWEAGSLVEVDPQKGPTDFKPPRKFTPSIETSAHASPVGRFRTPYACKIGDETVILAAYSHGPVSSVSGSSASAYGFGLENWESDCTPDFGIWKLKWTDSSKTELEPDVELVNTRQQADIDPTPIVPREKPPIIASNYDESQTSGEYLCLNVYENSLLKRAFEPQEKGGWRFRKDGNKADAWWEYSGSEDYSTPYDFSSLGEDATTVFKVRVLQGLPLYVLGNTHRRSSHYFHEPKRILGEVPVESDGSFRVRIPTGIPIHFQTLDKNDRVISTMRSWDYLNPTQPNMQTRVCVGCHERRGYTPPTGASLAMATQKEATDLTAEAAKPISQSRMHHFVRDVYPIIRKHCLPCHDNKNENGTYQSA